jgi:thymidylate synthase (FAD)
MKVDYIQHMGSDLTVVNAARVSFNKESQWDNHLGFQNVLEERDSKLIKYLADHNHWTPFGHCQVTFRIKAPIFVARQLGKHQVGMVWNEVSRRYVDSEPEFYEPEVWRFRADNVKQGSHKDGLTEQEVNIKFYDLEDGVYGAVHTPDELVVCAEETYQCLLNIGVCPEQARMVLPQSMYTEWYWTGSLAAYARVCKLRLDPHSQKETQEIAKMIDKEIEKLYPVSWKELMSK